MPEPLQNIGNKCRHLVVVFDDQNAQMVRRPHELCNKIEAPRSSPVRTAAGAASPDWQASACSRRVSSHPRQAASSMRFITRARHSGCSTRARSSRVLVITARGLFKSRAGDPTDHL
jgi:hypothetical protein